MKKITIIKPDSYFAHNSLYGYKKIGHLGYFLKKGTVIESRIPSLVLNYMNCWRRKNYI